MQEFQGTSLALTAAGFAAAMDSLSTGAPELWTVLTVETGACGFLPDRRPPILFERHIFSRLTNSRFDTCDVSAPTPGGYGADGAHQYDRLADAIGMDRPSALQSASWGMAQIMGENFAQAGFSDVESMVSAFSASEDAQLLGFVAFLKANRLDGYLQTHNWPSLARGYNGPNYAANQYDTKLAAAYQKFSAGSLPDVTVRAVQLYLTFAGFDTGGVDGIMGSHTQAALAAYQRQHGMPLSNSIDDATVAALAGTVLG